MNGLTQSDSLVDLEGLAAAARGWRGGILREPAPKLPVGGTELTGYRDYSPGDDHRHVDWNVCARHDELRVRLFAGRRDCHVRVLLDHSASMGLGAPGARFEAARRIAAAVSYVALDQQANVTILPFSDRLEGRIGPLRGKGRAGVLLRQLETLAESKGVTDFRRAVKTLVRLERATGPVVILSDLCDSRSFEGGMDVLRLAGHRPRVIHLVDPEEDSTVTRGDIELLDAESGTAWQVTLTESQVRRYRELAREDRDRPRRYCKKYRVPYISTGITGPCRCELGRIIAMRQPE